MTRTQTGPGPDERSLDAALDAAHAALAGRYDKESAPPADLTAGSTRQEAVDLLVHCLLDCLDPAPAAEQRLWIVGRQNRDGGFPLRAQGPSDLSSTVLAHVALQLVGHDEDEERLARAARFVVRHGGIDGPDAHPARFWLAFTRAVDWDRALSVPPQLLLLPSWAPGAVDGTGSTARALAAAVGVLGSMRPVREIPLDISSLRVGRSARAVLHRAATSALLGSARALGRRSPHPLRRAASREAERTILAGQQSDGGWGGDGLTTAVCALALWALGHSVRHPSVGAALGALARRRAVGNGAGGLPARLPATADHALALRALAEAGGRAGSDPVVDRVAERLLSGPNALTAHDPYPLDPVRDDRGAPAPVGEPAWDVDDTALALTALDRADAPRSPGTDAAPADSVRWLLERQSANGGWSRHGTSGLTSLGQRALVGPGFIELPSLRVTAHVVESLCTEGYVWHPAVGRALRLLLREQAVEGYWEESGSGRLRSTVRVLMALRAAGVRAGHLAVEGAMEWIYQQQNQDGGWGDDALSAPDGTGRASGPSTVAQTARCVVAAHTTGVLDRQRVEAAVALLLRRQNTAEGGWTDPAEHADPDHPPRTDVRTEAYALWALALHARRAGTVRGEGPRPVNGRPGATGPTDRTRSAPHAALLAHQEERR